ncbi:hypothetical protein NE237_009083 [Protea cynaroides]|uniref:RNase H type-1 domain-containing protein n=1 Tax=Protea cynaroides TaxID=273540 RepID=A0A9Q0KWW3_9MAGN|nr:hypothetical protein NE237_009083 [Protea cynaroides]
MARRVKASSDSQLVVRQVNREYEAKKANMAAHLRKVQEAALVFDSFTLNYILRDQNTQEDTFSKLATSDLSDLDHLVYNETLLQSTADPNSKAVMPAMAEPSWIDPIYSFLREGILPEERKEVRRIQSKATHYVVEVDTLYKKSLHIPPTMMSAPI